MDALQFSMWNRGELAENQGVQFFFLVAIGQSEHINEAKGKRIMIEVTFSFCLSAAKVNEDTSCHHS